MKPHGVHRSFTKCVLFAVLPFALHQVGARSTLSPLVLGNDVPYLVVRVLGQYPEQSDGGATHILAAGCQERAQLG